MLFLLPRLEHPAGGYVRATNLYYYYYLLYVVITFAHEVLTIIYLNSYLI